MTTITRNKENDEITLQVSATDCGRDFRFVLHGNHLVVEEKTAHVMFDKHEHWQPSLNWYDQLSQSEKLETFNHVLAEYRLRSLGDGDFKLAALGITESGDIYVSENTEQLSADYNRQCAEQNMVTISTQRDVYEQIKKNLKSGGEGDDFKPKNPRFRDVYLMGGQLPEIRIACPCGNCTDLLSKVMDKDANVWMLPVNAPGLGQAPLRINDHANAADELKPGEAWKATIGHLNKHRVITLDPPAAEEQRAAYDAILTNAETWAKAPRIRTLPSDVSDDDVKKSMHDSVAGMTAKLLQKAAKTEQLSLGDLDLEQRRALADRHIHWVRATAAQSTSGEREIGVWNKSTVGTTLPSPEIALIGAFGEDMVEHGIRRLEAMECSPRHVDNGTMRSSPKAVIERAVKNRPKNGEALTFRFHGMSDHAERGFHADFTPREIFPSYFTGKKPLPIVRDGAPTTKVQDGELCAPEPERAIQTR